MGKDIPGISAGVQNYHLGKSSVVSGNETYAIVTMKGQMPEAHADAILRHFGMT